MDVTDLLVSGPQTIVLGADDDPADLAKPRGKQDWKLEPHSIWYPRTTGIWQTVWIEKVPSTWIESLRWSRCAVLLARAARSAAMRRSGLATRISTTCCRSSATSV